MSKSPMIDREVDKIVQAGKSSKQAALANAWICGNFKGTRIKVLDVKKCSSLADYFVLTSVKNTVQAQAMADEIICQMKRLDCVPVRKEGLKGRPWVLIDVGSIIVHIFLEEEREQYDLDSLWEQAIPVPIPQEYYISADHQEDDEKVKSLDEYF